MRLEKLTPRKAHEMGECPFSWRSVGMEKIVITFGETEKEGEFLVTFSREEVMDMLREMDRMKEIFDKSMGVK